MKQRFYLHQRGEMFYLQDVRTGKQQSLETKDRETAQRLLKVKRHSIADPAFNHFIVGVTLHSHRYAWTKRFTATALQRLSTSSPSAYPSLTRLSYPEINELPPEKWRPG